jgi:hypothetical protein
VPPLPDPDEGKLTPINPSVNLPDLDPDEGKTTPIPSLLPELDEDILDGSPATETPLPPLDQEANVILKLNVAEPAKTVQLMVVRTENRWINLPIINNKLPAITYLGDNQYHCDYSKGYEITVLQRQDYAKNGFLKFAKIDEKPQLNWQKVDSTYIFSYTGLSSKNWTFNHSQQVIFGQVYGYTYDARTQEEKLFLREPHGKTWWVSYRKLNPAERQYFKATHDSLVKGLGKT